ncbi:MAG: aminoglycoside phosphotransferase family protein [candidate division WOR-3 bacterium]|nr:aminoglycoside phosphotransferase family protein [candidate division WOR-3 bacterium]MCX7947719.1 aminoglycoside phosphotransferase family protein [candidate division WOR-3 bacterium]MDW8150358.1 aminoglycoside phosphotransferase family protein [candidate division WOR-3 bacterium]
MEIIGKLEDGSDRVFYRVKVKNQTYILLREKKRYRFENYIKISSILYPFSPKIFSINETNMEILMEDLGDLSLFEYVKKYKDYKIYFKIIDFLKEIQNINTKLPEFDQEHLIHEINYFLEYNPEYETYRDFLYENAKLVSEFEKCFMHRDFQSRNIVIKDGKIRVIDFQNAHIGPKLYDLTSLLMDPYVNLDYKSIREYFNYYNDEYEKFLRVSIQRTAQVCAAYKKLSKTKEFFKQFISIALDRFKHLISFYFKIS